MNTLPSTLSFQEIRIGGSVEKTNRYCSKCGSPGVGYEALIDVKNPLTRKYVCRICNHKEVVLVDLGQQESATPIVPAEVITVTMSQDVGRVRAFSVCTVLREEGYHVVEGNSGRTLTGTRELRDGRTSNIAVIIMHLSMLHTFGWVHIIDIQGGIKA